MAAPAPAHRPVALDEVDQLAAEAGGVLDPEVELEPDVVGASAAPARRDVGRPGKVEPQRQLAVVGLDADGEAPAVDVGFGAGQRVEELVVGQPVRPAVLMAAAWATLALIPVAVAVGVALGVLSAAVVVAGVATAGLRQRLVPEELAGRVVAATRTFSHGAAPLGALAGGALARTWGLRAPYAAGAAAVLAATALARPTLRTWPRDDSDGRRRRR